MADLEDIPKSELFDLVEKINHIEVSRNLCFLCGERIESTEATHEHVFPKWLQRRFDLWDSHLVLLNGTILPYRQFTIPCHAECNRKHLKQIEDEVSKATVSGVSSVKEIPSSCLLWLGKIFFGILYKELFLALDQTNPQKGGIVSPDFLKLYRHQRLILQQARGSLALNQFQSGSLFVFSTQEHKNKKLNWDFCDDINSQFVGCRIGPVGLLCVLGDGGAQQYYHKEFSAFSDLCLHPAQFREVCAKVAYGSMLATRTPKRVLIEGGPHQMYQLPLGGYLDAPLHKQGSALDYAKVLSHFSGVPIDELYEEPNRVTTWLKSSDGKYQFLDFEKYPFWP